MTDLTNKDLLEKLMQAINIIREEGKTNKEELKQEIKAENSKVLKILEEQAHKINNLTTKYDELELRCTNLERFYRKNNIILFGLEIPNGSTLLNYTLEKLTELLGIPLNDTDINNIYKLRGDKIPPIKLEFVTYLKKNLVIKNRHKLKGTKIFIAHDLSPEEREQQKVLTTHLKLARSKNYMAKIKGNTLQINDEIYSLEQLRDIDRRQENYETNTVEQQIEYRPASNSAPPTPSVVEVNFPEIFEIEHNKNEDNPIEYSSHEKLSTEKIKTTPAEKRTNTSPADPVKEKEKEKIVRTNTTTSVKTDKSDRTTRRQCKQQTEAKSPHN